MRYSVGVSVQPLGVQPLSPSFPPVRYKQVGNSPDR